MRKATNNLTKSLVLVIFNHNFICGINSAKHISGKTVAWGYGYFVPKAKTTQSFEKVVETRKRGDRRRPATNELTKFLILGSALERFEVVTYTVVHERACFRPLGNTERSPWDKKLMRKSSIQ